jgi:hypothetical protein
MPALPESPDISRPESPADMALATPIFLSAAGMVGVCLTVVGVFQAVVHIGQVETLADELVAANALVFLLACGVAYLALRAPSPQQRRRWQRVADGVFLFALTLMGAICALVAYELI